MKTYRSLRPRSIALAASGLMALAASAGAQTTLSQFFNNNNQTFIDTQATLYNWQFATANLVATPVDNVSAGNTKSGEDVVEGEVSRGRGFFFVLPLDSGQPGATVMYTTYMGTSAHMQNNPQPRWFRDGEAAILGRTVSEIQSIAINERCASEMSGRIGIQINGTTWLFSTVENTFGTGGSWNPWTETNLTGKNWITNGFVGGVPDTDLSNNATVSLTGNEVVTGYAIHVDTDALAGGSARVRLDQMVVTVLDPVSPPVAPGVQVSVSGASVMELSVDSLAGQIYELEKSVDGMTTWDTINPLQEGTGSPLTFQDVGAKPVSGEKVFYRVAATK